MHRFVHDQAEEEGEEDDEYFADDLSDEYDGEVMEEFIVPDGHGERKRRRSHPSRMLNEQSALEHEVVVARLARRFAAEEPDQPSLHDSAPYRTKLSVQRPRAHPSRAPRPDASSLHRPGEQAAHPAGRRADIARSSSTLMSVFGSNLDDLPPQPSRVSFTATGRGVPKLGVASPSSAKRSAPHAHAAKAQPMTASRAAAILRGHKVPNSPGVRPNLQAQRHGLWADSSRAPERAVRKLPIPGALYGGDAVRLAGIAKPAAYKIKKQPMPPSPSIANKNKPRGMSVRGTAAESAPNDAQVSQAVPRSPAPPAVAAPRERLNPSAHEAALAAAAPRQRLAPHARESIAGGAASAASARAVEQTPVGDYAPELAAGEKKRRRPTPAEAIAVRVASNAAPPDVRHDGGFGPSAMRNAAGRGVHATLPPANRSREPGPVEFNRWADRRERALMARQATAEEVARKAAAAAAPAAAARATQEFQSQAAPNGRLTLLPVDDLLGSRGPGPGISTRPPRATAAISPRTARVIAAEQAQAADLRERKEHALIKAMRQRQEQGLMAARRACAEL